MPVIGIAGEDILTTGSKHVITFGKVQGIDTTSGGTISGGESWAAGDILYISTTPGVLTTQRPQGDTQIQRMAQVLRVDNSGGQLLVFNTARSAGLPNLTDGYLWIGNSVDQPVEKTLTEIGGVTGTGTSNYVTKWDTSGSGLTDSQITDDGTTVSVNNASPDASFTFYVSGDTKVIGSFEADSKSFDIVHPTQEGKRLRYGSLEGPEYGVYVRGKLSGENIIELPEHWTGLVDENSITVQLTPCGRKQDLYVGDIINNTVEVLGDESPECYYIVFGERKDIDRITVEY
jgi:hypothetical protein